MPRSARLPNPRLHRWNGFHRRPARLGFVAAALAPLLALLLTGLPSGAPHAEDSAQEAAPAAAAEIPGLEPAVAERSPAERARVLADAAYREGFALQRERRTLEAIEAYERALALDPFHPKAHYELGWSHWVLGEWADVLRHWEIAAELGLDEPQLPEFLERAREQASGKVEPLVHVPIGERAAWLPPPGDPRPPLRLELAARFQHYDPEPAHPADRFDRYVFSPKAVHVSADGQRAYVNALEGFVTLVYGTASLERRGTIWHRFDDGRAGLFAGEAGEPWTPLPPEAAPAHRFSGKPVEFAATHGGRYLWVSYYRRDRDALGIWPSAVAIVDTRSDAIVRVIGTGPIPKFLAASPDGHWLAVVHWGDNTVGLIDIRGDDPAAFRRDGLIVVGRRLALDPEEDVDRDRYCGYCLRGAVFTADSRHLLVGRMGGGGIAVLDVAGRRHVGTVYGMKPTPRHLLRSAGGERLYVGSNVGGYVSVYRVGDLVAAAQVGRRTLPPLREVATGPGTRTIALSPDERVLYAAVNNGSRLVALDGETLEPLLSIPADSFPVGLDVSPDGSQVWVTAQGRQRRGGNSVSVYRVSRER